MPERLGVDHWRVRAKEARHLAEQITDADVQWRMMRIANDYEKIAEKAEARIKARSAEPRRPISN